MIKNEYKCGRSTWRKFSDEEKKRYNEIVRQLRWKGVYPPKTKFNEVDIEIIAHNAACLIVWGNL